MQIKVTSRTLIRKMVQRELNGYNILVSFLRKEKIYMDYLDSYVELAASQVNMHGYSVNQVKDWLNIQLCRIQRARESLEVDIRLNSSIRPKQWISINNRYKTYNHAKMC